MNPIDPRTLKPGQRVRWTRTVEGVVRADSAGDVEINADGGGSHGIYVGRGGAVDTFELLAPPLPTKPGSTVVARLSGMTFPRVLALGLKNGQPAWFVADASGCTDTIDPSHITEWALLDEVHTVRDPEPCLFANEHKRWSQYPAILHPQERVEWGGITGTLVECSRCGPGHLLLDPDEEQYGTEPEAPLPTEITSLILAKIRSAPEPYLLSLGSQNAKPTWFVAGCLPIRSVSADLIEDWVQIDPETLRPVGDPS